MADELLEDDAVAIGAAVRAAFSRGLPAQERSAQVQHYRSRLAAIDPQQPLDGAGLRKRWGSSPLP